MSNMYDILNKLNAVEQAAQPKATAPKAKSKLAESMETVEGQLSEKYMGFKAVEKAVAAKGARPGWMLKQDPVLGAKVKAAIDKKKKENELMRKYAGKKIGEEVEEGFDPMFQPNVQDTGEDYAEFTDKDIDDMINSVHHEDDIMDMYDDDEFVMIDAETGEEIKEELDVSEEAILEVLSRSERMRAKARFARTKSKRER